MTYFDITLHIYLEILTCGYRLSPLSYPLPPATPISPPTGTSDPDKSWSTDNFCDDEPPLPKTKHDKINKLKNKPLSTNNNVSAQNIKMNSQLPKKISVNREPLRRFCPKNRNQTNIHLYIFDLYIFKQKKLHIITYKTLTYSNKKYIHLYIEQIELAAKLLDRFLGSNKSNINQLHNPYRFKQDIRAYQNK